MKRLILDGPFTSSLFCVAAFAVCAAVTACGGNGGGANDDMGGGDPDAGGAENVMKVNGKVLDGRGLPVGGVAIKIDEAVTISGIDGTFSIPTAKVPYRVLVGGRPPGGYYRSVVVYDQLSRLDPTLRLYDADVENENTNHFSSVSGTFAGITSPLGQGQLGYLTLDVSESSLFYTSGADLTISRNLFWSEPSKTVMTTLRALFWTGSGDNVSYLGAGKLDVMLEDRKTITLTNPIALTPPTEGMISGTLTLPATASSAFVTPSVRYSDRNTIPMTQFTVVDENFAMKSAAIDDATFELVFESRVGDRFSNVMVHGLTSGATIPAFTMPSPTALVQPVNAATGVTATTDFQIMPGSTGLVHVVHFDSAGSFTWTLVTTSSTFRFPDGTSLGIPMPTPGEDVNWQARSVTAADIDAFAGSTDLLDARSAVPAGTPYPYSQSEFYSFQM
jgi:hypothetical protein